MAKSPKMHHPTPKVVGVSNVIKIQQLWTGCRVRLLKWSPSPTSHATPQSLSFMRWVDQDRGATGAWRRPPYGNQLPIGPTTHPHRCPPNRQRVRHTRSRGCAGVPGQLGLQRQSETRVEDQRGAHERVGMTQNHYQQ